SDRIAVMSAGVLQQVGAPRDLYDNPATPFVATFVGETNAIPGKVHSVEGGIAAVDTGIGLLRGRAGAGISVGKNAKIYVRPEALSPAVGGDDVISATVERIDFEGAFALAHGRLKDGSPMVVSIPSTDLASAPAIGGQAAFGFASKHAV